MPEPLSEDQIRALIRAETGHLGVLVRQLQGLVRPYDGSPEGVLDGPYGVMVQDRTTGDVYRKTTASGTLTGWTTNFP